jgi:hypothetical protein
VAIHVKRSGAWVEVPDGQLYVKRAGAWVVPSKVYVKRSGAWVEVWPTGGGGGTPVTYTFNPTSSDSYREVNKWRGESSGIYQCSWDFGDHIGILAFDFDDIIAKCGGKTVSKATLRLSRSSGGGGTVKPLLWEAAASTIDNSYNVITSAGKPNLINNTRTELALGLTIGGTITNTIPTSMIDSIIAGTARGFGFATSETLQGDSTGGGGQKPCYANFTPASGGTSTRPQLKVTVLE